MEDHASKRYSRSTTDRFGDVIRCVGGQGRGSNGAEEKGRIISVSGLVA